MSVNRYAGWTPRVQKVTAYYLACSFCDESITSDCRSIATAIDEAQNRGAQLIGFSGGAVACQACCRRPISEFASAPEETA